YQTKGGKRRTIRIGEGFLSFEDPKTKQTLSSASPRSLVCERRIHHFRTKSGYLTHLVLSITFPGVGPVSITNQDHRWSWKTEAPLVKAAPGYIIGSAEWPELLEALGLRSEAVMSEKS